MYWKRLVFVWVGVFLAASVCTASDSTEEDLSRRIFGEMPDEIDPSARYLFYLHGRIIEGKGVRPTHPQFGVYEYQEILEALADRGFVVISEVRPSGADVPTWAERVARQVRRLIDGGVPPAHITVVGFSKGGVIAIFASAELANDRVNFVFMGACGPWLKGKTDLVPHGRMLALRKSSDNLVGSCTNLFDRLDAEADRREEVTHLGGGHGAYYRPQPEWVDEIVTWAAIKE